MGRLPAIFLVAALLCPPPALAAVVRVPKFSAPSGPLNAAAPASGGFSRAPGAPSLVDFSLDAPRIASLYGDASAKLIAALDAVAARPDAALRFDNSVGAIETAYADYLTAVSPASFLSAVSPKKEVRDAVAAWQKASSALLLEQTKREDLYRKVLAYSETDEAKSLTGERQKLLDESLLDFRTSGMGLDAEAKARLKRVESRLSELSQAFSRNLSEWDDGIEVRRGELAGLSSSFIDSLPKAPGGKLRISVEPTVYGLVMTKARSAGLRRRLYYRMQKKAAAVNMPILKETLALRREKANLLGYRNFAEMALDGRMAKTPSTVFGFLKRLRKMLKDAAKKEGRQVVRRKKKDDPKAKKLYPWDAAYYGEKLKTETLRLDADRVKEYFPVEKVVERTLGVYEELLGLRFEAVEEKAWHADVRAFVIRDGKTNARIGKFFLDLHPRPGKRSGAAAYTIIGGRLLPDGRYQEPVSAMVANFPKPVGDKPALMQHDNVRTLFHEFGHIMHQTLTTADRWSFAGSRTARDFVEAPSQMMENFIWREDVLTRISGHYRTGESIPAALVKKMIAARDYHAASATLGQVMLAAMDLAYHTLSVVDPLDVYRRVSRIVHGGKPNAASRFPARFAHIMGGYAAAYYGYLWSKVYAQDIYSIFDAAGGVSPRVGARYRRAILERGSTREEMDSLREFLGREPSEEAFLRWLGSPEK